MQNDIKYDEIDMEINPALLDDDDDSFNFIASKPTKKSTINSDNDLIESMGEERPLKRNTGITINLKEDDYPSLDTIATLDSQPIICESENDIMNAVNDTNTAYGKVKQGLFEETDFGGYNMIDMECSIGEDDDFDDIPSKKNKIDFGDEEVDPELVAEDLKLAENKKLTQGQVEDDYWERITKRHKKSNKDGAGVPHVHYGGDPKLAMELFNDDCTPQSKIPTITDGEPAGTIASGFSETADVSSGEMSGGEGMACGESKEKDNNRKLFENLLLITGFNLIPDKEGFVLKDLCNLVPDMQCKDEKEAINQLEPYISDTLYLPLKHQTGKDFTSAQEWCDWYDKEEDKEKYKNCNSDIDYCRMLSNYLK